VKSPRAKAVPVRARLAGVRQSTLFQIAAGYAVGAWIVIQVTATVAPAFELSGWFLRAVILLAVLGFVATVGFFAFVAPGRGRQQSGPERRRTRVVAVAGACALFAALIAGVLTIARTTLFGEEQVSLAVLPFADLSPGRDKAYLAEGVAEEILSALGKNSGLKVLGRSSSRALRDKAGDPAAIRASLGITHLLEGSVRAAGSDLRLSVRLIRTADGAQEWAEDYRGTGEDVFALQDKVANAVAKRLSVMGQETVQTASAQITSAEAYNRYLAARRIARARNEPELKRAYGLAREVVAAKPDFAPGHALLAELIWLLSDGYNNYGSVPTAKARPIAIAHARKAIQLSPAASEGYAALGYVSPPQESLKPLMRAIELDPSRSELRMWLGISFSQLGRYDEMLEQYREAAAIEPLWFAPLNVLVQGLAAAGHFDEALSVVQRFERRGGAKGQVHRFMAHIARLRPDHSAAILHSRVALAADPKLPYIRRTLATDLYMLGLPQQAPAKIAEEFKFNRLFYDGRTDEIARLAQSNGDEIWNAPDGEFVVHVLAARRDWAALVALHATAPRDSELLCNGVWQGPVFAIALSKAGRSAEAKALLDCNQARLDVESRMKARATDLRATQLEYRRASLMAAKGAHADSMAWLDKAIAHGWIGRPYSSRLSDYPQFDASQENPKFAALQRRIDATIARERAEVLRDLGAAR